MENNSHNQGKCPPIKGPKYIVHQIFGDNTLLGKLQSKNHFGHLTNDKKTEHSFYYFLTPSIPNFSPLKKTNFIRKVHLMHLHPLIFFGIPILPTMAKGITSSLLCNLYLEKWYLGESIKIESLTIWLDKNFGTTQNGRTKILERREQPF